MAHHRRRKAALNLHFATTAAAAQAAARSGAWRPGWLASGGPRAAGCGASASPVFSEPRAARQASAQKIRFEAGGRITLVLGTQSNGQGHETSFAQIAADLLGLPVAAFRFVQGHTRTVKSGNGHGGARSMHMGGTALHHAAKMVLAKGRALAAHGKEARRAQAAEIGAELPARSLA